ncbi:hypothetical protein Tco_0768701, partial [Tanacetum coccineum]
EDASKQGRKIADLDGDAEVTLVDEAQEMNDDNLMFDTRVFDEQEVEVEKVVSIAEVTTTSATTIIVDDFTLAQTLIEIKAAKPKAVTTAATITTTVVTRPKARGVVVQEPSEFTTTTSLSQPSQLPHAKDKGKAKMVEPKKPLKKKAQILIDEEIAQILQEEFQVELEEEERLARQKEEDANIFEWDNVQATIDADYELAARLHAQEQEELTIEERSKVFVELMDKIKKHFARLRVEEQRRKPPTKAQKRSQMSTYLKHMARYKQNQLKSKNYDKIQKLFDKAMTRVNMFVDMDTELVKESSKKAEMLDENVEAEVDDEAEMKKHMETVSDDEVAIDAIPLDTKPPIIVDWKIIKEGKIGYFQIIRAYGSSRRYSSMIKMLQNIDREDLETLWKLVKVKHGNTRPEEAYERVYFHAAIACENSSKKVTIARLCISAAKANNETINAATKKVTSASNHYKEPTELEIQEMVNILVSEEEYDKVFNHLDMLHAPLEKKVLILTNIHKEEKDEGCNAKKIMGSRNQDNFFRHHLENKVVFEGVESVTPMVKICKLVWARFRWHIFVMSACVRICCISIVLRLLLRITWHVKRYMSLLAAIAHIVIYISICGQGFGVIFVRGMGPSLIVVAVVLRTGYGFKGLVGGYLGTYKGLEFWLGGRLRGVGSFSTLAGYKRVGEVGCGGGRG